VTDATLPAAPPGPSPIQDLGQPGLYFNRELSWLEFNRRVLHEAQDIRTPLLERLKFIGIFSSNLDEFFQIRVAGLKDQLAAGYSERTADGLTPDEQLRRIAAMVQEMVRDHARCLHEEILPALAAEGVALLDVGGLNEPERQTLDRYFQDNVFPVLTPLAVDPAHPFPYISNLSLSLAVAQRAADGEERFARVKVPKILPRWVPVAAGGWR
jgi:polyphosphate kinase